MKISHLSGVQKCQTRLWSGLCLDDTNTNSEVNEQGVKKWGCTDLCKFFIFDPRNCSNQKRMSSKKKSNCSAHLFEHVRVLWHSSLNILNNLFIKSKCFQECSATGISPDTTDSLFRFLEDHSNKEPPRSGMFHDTCSVTSEDQEQLEKAVACLVKIIHLIHHANLSNQHQVCKLCHWFKWIILQVTVHSCGKS